jgi:hypothetical protein
VEADFSVCSAQRRCRLGGLGFATTTTVVLKLLTLHLRALGRIGEAFLKATTASVTRNVSDHRQRRRLHLPDLSDRIREGDDQLVRVEQSDGFDDDDREGFAVAEDLAPLGAGELIAVLRGKLDRVPIDDEECGECGYLVINTTFPLLDAGLRVLAALELQLVIVLDIIEVDFRLDNSHGFLDRISNFEKIDRDDLKRLVLVLVHRSASIRLEMLMLFGGLKHRVFVRDINDLQTAVRLLGLPLGITRVGVETEVENEFEYDRLHGYAPVPLDGEGFVKNLLFLSYHKIVLLSSR